MKVIETKNILKQIYLMKHVFTFYIPSKNTMYTCRVLLQIQSVYFSMKDNKNGI